MRLSGNIGNLNCQGNVCQRPKAIPLTIIPLTLPCGKTTRYLYDGMRAIQERDGNNTPAVRYTRGNDLSGSIEGAGGIGGLLARSKNVGNAWINRKI